MTGKCYYVTTLDAWQRHAPRFASSHFVMLNSPAKAEGEADPKGASAGDARILVLVEADEGVHLALEDEPAFEALPHPLAQKPISESAQATLAQHGVPAAATTFDVAEMLARVHPLLRHRVF